MDTSFEVAAQKTGAKLIAGIDEVGRGALAGPVVAAAVILDLKNLPEGLNDSKKLSASKRERLDLQIRETALAFSITFIEAEEIDRINILQATKKAMIAAILGLSLKPDYLLIDALRLKEITIQQEAIIKGDAKSVSIAAASIIAKVARDKWMAELGEKFTAYSFSSNFGYGTASHINALRQYGHSPIHRLTFRKVLPEPEQRELFS